jgi:hypothetical protein
MTHLQHCEDSHASVMAASPPSSMVSFNGVPTLREEILKRLEPPV